MTSILIFEVDIYTAMFTNSYHGSRKHLYLWLNIVIGLKWVLNTDGKRRLNLVALLLRPQKHRPLITVGKDKTPFCFKAVNTEHPYTL